MTPHLVSVVLPAYRQADHIGQLLGEFDASLSKLPIASELLVVVNGPSDGTLEACEAAARELERVRVLKSGPGWGEAVQEGLKEARGDLLCYTNSARTNPGDLTLLLLYAIAHPGTVVKASRKTRDSVVRRFGSLLYNLECRALFDLSNFDVNGTPKVFPRDFDGLLHLAQRDDLIDLEFNVAARRFGYPMIEVPVLYTGRRGGVSTTGYRSALRMYWGAYRMRRVTGAEPS